MSDRMPKPEAVQTSEFLQEQLSFSDCCRCPAPRVRAGRAGSRPAEGEPRGGGGARGPSARLVAGDFDNFRPRAGVGGLRSTRAKCDLIEWEVAPEGAFVERCDTERLRRSQPPPS
ncbi:hypothetical protein GN956_G20730 [Arapaima gigas]